MSTQETQNVKDGLGMGLGMSSIMVWKIKFIAVGMRKYI